MYDELNEILELLESFLGPSKNGYNEDTQIQFNCPSCAEEKGCVDNKYNLEINIRKNIFKCWVCGETNYMSGSIPKLIKRYGNELILTKYFKILNDLKKTKLYEFKFGNDNENEFTSFQEIVQMPKNFNKIKDINENIQPCLYLKKRGINQKIIDYFNIGYTKINNEKAGGRIIIPSYDCIGSINYWVGRDYTNKNLFKYENPKSNIIKKTDITFNEGKINWDADIVLVEGPFDHIVVPNSIPLLGKSLKKDYNTYRLLEEKSKGKILIFLDDDAENNAINLYKFLNQNLKFKERIRYVQCPKNMDASLIYEKYGVNGIRSVLRNSYKIKDYYLC